MDEQLDINAILREFRYKPNFYIITQRYGETWIIKVTMYVENSREYFQPWEIQREESQFITDGYNRFAMPPSMYSPRRPVVEVTGSYEVPRDFRAGHEKAFLHWFIERIKDLEMHEMYEWVRYKGELINDPHKVGI
jgi:hypothetical protein